jgi:hypothetical protein
VGIPAVQRAALLAGHAWASTGLAMCGAKRSDPWNCGRRRVVVLLTECDHLQQDPDHVLVLSFPLGAVEP